MRVYTHQDALTNIEPIRPPSRRNQFTILAKACVGSDMLLLQQAQHEQNGGIRPALESRLQVLATDNSGTHQDTHLVPVHGTLTRSLPSDIAPSFIPGSYASTHAPSRPIHVVTYYPRGSLRKCLDRGDFLMPASEGSTPTRSNKLAILRDIATALHYIHCNFPGQQHGAVSSDNIFLDNSGQAFLSWYHAGATLRDFYSGKAQYWRWFTPTALAQLQHVLQDSGKRDPLDVVELEMDDMYAFGILAWELAVEERPYEGTDLPIFLRTRDDLEQRFVRTAPDALQQLIQQCLLPDKDKRPAWCDLISTLNSLIAEPLDAIPHLTTDAQQTTAVSTVPEGSTSASEADEKSKVVEMMETVLSSTFYRRDLPAHLHSFTSAAGKRLFREMILAGTGECFFRLCTSFNTQSDPAFCGVSSLSMVLNALEIDPRRQWRGVWRWYSDEQLDCCASVDVMKQKGITFNQFSCLARCHARVVTKRANRHTLEEFRRDIQAVASSDESHLVLSFSRAALGQTGSGHFSPIGGYHAGEDKVLVLDTARFKYPPFYATVTELWNSLLPKDPETGLCRGYFLISTTAKQKLDIQQKRLQALSGLHSSDMYSSASSSSVSLPSQADDPPDDNATFESIVPVEDGDKPECDCDCKEKTATST
ncbi:hypothetical protein BGZ70_002330 [Mortierella alpina]|uniref:glutathione gamma-glutamylcysteinyltransferase n=1 Tax=Mortierella alpina TaxID=64518 RepID=A0A9P6M5L1_MORAP|nr:hypothetical protein BGZ70_002330 [Mortierella alpina]